MKLLINTILSIFILLLASQAVSCKENIKEESNTHSSIVKNKINWDAGVLQEALNAKYVQWANDPNVNTEYTKYGVLYSVKALNYLSLVAFYDKNNQYPEVASRITEQLKYLISGGKEPCCRGVIAGWADNALAQSLALVKHTDAIWSNFSDVEKEKLDLLMKALAIAGNYCQNSQNNVHKGLYQVFNWQKGWNPNHQEGYVGVMISAWIYFGGSEPVNAIFREFDYDQYIADFQSYGFENVKSCWLATGKELMENGGTDSGDGTTKGVKIPFTYSSLAGFGELDYDPYLLYRDLGARMFKYPVTSNECNGSTFIADGTKSPFEGQMGMCYEFRAQDAQGCRSSAVYCFEGWLNNILTLGSIQAFGLLPESKEVDDLIANMKVGSADLHYKLQHGYQARKNGKYNTESENSVIHLGYVFVMDIYNMILDKL